MPHWSSLRGHLEQREMFQRAISRGRLAQAYLFIGPDGIGKQQFAHRLAQYLLCHAPTSDALEACHACAACRPFLAAAHPDFLWVGCPEGKRELPIELIVGPKERRGQEGLCHDLSVRPLASSRKIAIINDADLMNEASGNALLKTLEEPPDRAMLFLIGSNLDAMLPTIRSRCQLVRFSPLCMTDIVELLLEQGLVSSRDDADFAAALSEGSLTVARQLVEPHLRSLRSTLYLGLGQRNFSGLSLSKSLMEQIDKISADTPAQRVNILWVIRFAVEFYRATLLRLCRIELQGNAWASPIPEASTFADRVGSSDAGIERVGLLIDRAVTAVSQIDQNLSISLTLDALFDDFAKISRSLETVR
ncbi:MAG: hypothetical protein NTW75_06360 [Planctomycetales bacterium]|nr:hypothetical protein [Planctomycetales bacterium]